LSDWGRTGRKVFFDFATLPGSARRADSTDLTGYQIRFNGWGEFPADCNSVIGHGHRAAGVVGFVIGHCQQSFPLSPDSKLFPKFRPAFHLKLQLALLGGSSHVYAQLKTLKRPSPIPQVALNCAL
jgi:hypothetical protein